MSMYPYGLSLSILYIIYIYIYPSCTWGLLDVENSSGINDNSKWVIFGEQNRPGINLRAKVLHQISKVFILTDGGHRSRNPLRSV